MDNVPQRFTSQLVSPIATTVEQQLRRGWVPSKYMRKEGSPSGDRFDWQSPQAPKVHVSEVFGFLDFLTPHLWAGGARVSRGPSVDLPLCPSSLQSSRVLGGPNPDEAYSGEVPKAASASRVAMSMMGEVGERIEKGLSGSSGEGQEEQLKERASRGHTNVAMKEP